MDRFEQIIKKAESFVLSTVDKNGFPKNIILSQVLERSGSVTLLFYLDEQIKIMNIIKSNPRGTVSCAVHHETHIETLNLNGTFTIEPAWKIQSVTKDDQSTAGKNVANESVVVIFEVMHHEIEVVNKLV